jgi:hypothetical protein
MQRPRLPRFAVDLDPRFERFERVFILGDLHDSEEQFRTFLFQNDIGFIRPGNADLHSLSSVYVKPGVLLVFLGDVLYKTENHFKCIARFILRNRENCLLVLGNNEVKFVYEHFHLFVDVSRPFLRRCRFDELRSLDYSGAAEQHTAFYRAIDSIYSLIAWFRCAREDNELKRSWLWFYDCLSREYDIDGSDCEELMILMYILTEAVVIGYSNRCKLMLLHAGLNPNRAIENQLVIDVCNIRFVKNRAEKTPWFEFYEHLDYTILFGHWSALTRGEDTARPHFFANTVCLDTGCCTTGVLSFVTLRPRTTGAIDMNSFVVNKMRVDDFVFHEILFSDART